MVFSCWVSEKKLGDLPPYERVHGEVLHRQNTAHKQISKGWVDRSHKFLGFGFGEKITTEAKQTSTETIVVIQFMLMQSPRYSADRFRNALLLGQLIFSIVRQACWFFCPKAFWSCGVLAPGRSSNSLVSLVICSRQSLMVAASLEFGFRIGLNKQT